MRTRKFYEQSNFIRKKNIFLYSLILEIYFFDVLHNDYAVE